MRSALFVFTAVAPIIAVLLYPFGLIVALSPIFLSHMLLLFAMLVPNCQWWGPVVRSFATTEAEVWLTIDDGPSEQTIAILDALDRYTARATFFVIGTRAETHPHLITEIIARGHQVANHTFSHRSATIWAAGPRTIAREIDRCAVLLRSTPQRPAQFFRAPAGLKSPFLHPALRQRSLQLIGWSVRAFDTMHREPERIARAIAAKAKPGAIILLHEGHHDSNPDAIATALDRLNAAGFRFVIPGLTQLRTSAGGK